MKKAILRELMMNHGLIDHDGMVIRPVKEEGVKEEAKAKEEAAVAATEAAAEEAPAASEADAADAEADAPSRRAAEPSYHYGTTTSTWRLVGRHVESGRLE